MLEEARVLFVTVAVKMGERERREMKTCSDVAAQTCKRLCLFDDGVDQRAFMLSCR